MKKRILSYLLSFALIFGIFYGINLPVFADDTPTPAEYFTYVVNDDGNSVTITKYIGEFEEVIIPSIIDGKAVTNIGDIAFANCSADITSVIIPEGVISIEHAAFSGCFDLTNVIIPDSLETIGPLAFGTCVSLKTVNIPNGVIIIGNAAFAECASLTTINVPDTVISIGDKAFSAGDCLTSINVSEGNPYYSSVDGVLFNKDQTKLIEYPSGKPDTTYIMPDTVTTLVEGAFSNSAKLATVTLSKNLTSIAGSAFYNCDALINVSIPANITSIGSSAFNSCDNLVTVILSNNITDIGSSAFSFCKSLTNITIPNSVTTIGNSAFQRCDSLTSITIPDSVTSMGNSTFAYCENLTSIVLSNNLTSLESSIFNGCSSLPNITIPDKVESIASSAFDSCPTLTSINVNEANAYYSSAEGVLFNKDKTELIEYPEGKTDTTYIIPDTVTSISSQAFENCENLTTAVIPDSVTDIEVFAFQNCKKLTDVFYTGTEEEWKKISVGYANDALLNATIHYESAFDVMVSAAGCSQSTIAEGDEISFYATVRNIGNNIPSGDITVDFYLDGRLIESKTVTENIESGKSLVVYSTNQKSALFGSHAVKVMVTSANSTFEADDTNNIIKSRFLVD